MEVLPPSIRSAYEKFASEYGDRITDSLGWGKDEGAFRFRFKVCISGTNLEKFPEQVELQVVIPQTFPFDAPEFYPLSQEVRGFPHQDAETGKLCLASDTQTSLQDKEFADYAREAEEWLLAASSGNLVRCGDPYELPDFSRRKLAKRLIRFPAVYCCESSGTFPVWKDLVGTWGKVVLRPLAGLPGISPVRFNASKDITIATTPLEGSRFESKAIVYNGTWLLLSSLCHVRHRPAQSIDEMVDLCHRDGIDFYTVLQFALKQTRKSVAPCLILAGMPIPRRFGEVPDRIHWQPMYFDGVSKLLCQTQNRRSRSVNPDSIYCTEVRSGQFQATSPIPWGRTENISDENQYARGSLQSELCNMQIAICGCGAIGSIAAELLARAGCRRLSLYDSESFELGNQCRHTLDGGHIDTPKAIALARRLQSCNPQSSINGFRVRFPLKPGEELENSDHVKILMNSDLVLDCGMTDSGFQWMNETLRRRRIPFATLFVNVRATMMTLALSGQRASCRDVLVRLNRKVDAGELPFDRVAYDPELTNDLKVLPELGCWHATFPARNNHIWMLTSAALEVVEGIVGELHGRDQGFACVLRRNEYRHGAGPTSFVETAWEGLL